MMKSPKDKSLFPSEPNINGVQLYGMSAPAVPTKRFSSKRQENLKIATTATLQQYVELRKQQQIMQRNSAVAVFHPPIIPDSTQFSLSPLACRITSVVENALFHNISDNIGRSTVRKQNNSQCKTKKVVTFATNQNVIIHYDIDTNTLSKKASVALFWYTAQEYAKFRTESNDMATYGSGDIDFQQFFLNTLYPYCRHIAGTIRNGKTSIFSPSDNNIAVPVSPTDSDSDSTISTFSSSSTALTDNDSCTGGSSISSNHSSLSPSIGETMYNEAVDTSELEMMSKYRGLERIMFRHILQDLKFEYIKRCVKEEADNCYYDSDENDMDLDDCSTIDPTSTSTIGIDAGNFRHHMYTSQVMAQFIGQIDQIVVEQDNYEYFLAQHKLQLEQKKMAKEEKKKRCSKAKRNRGQGDQKDDHYSYGNFRPQTIEI